MIPKTLDIGPLTFHAYGLIFSLSIIAGWLLVKRRSHLYKIPADIFDGPIFLIPLILGIIGARFYHVVDYWDVYAKNIASIANLSGGGLGIWGGLAGAFLGFWIIAKVKKLNILSFFDLLAPSFLLGQALGRFGNFINREAFGPPTNLPWGIYINPENRPAQFANFTHFHPTFFYEMAIDLLMFFILLKISSKLKTPGMVLALYLIFYSTGRLFAEFFRIDTWKIGDLKISYLLSAITLVVGLILFAAKKADFYPKPKN